MNAKDTSMQPAVSILVPTYNAERYLATCLESLARQSLHSIEVIVIDDGSIDASTDIMDNFAATDARFRIVRKTNSGYGDSMNQGIQIARGTYLGICEPDDFCHKHMFKKLYRAARRFRADIVKANYYEHTTGKDTPISILERLPYKCVFNPADVPQILLVRPSIWTAIYRREMIEDASICFTPSPGASFQDASFGHQCWATAQRAVLLPRPLYHYRTDNQNSSSMATDKVYAVCDEYQRSFEFLEKQNTLATFGPMLGAMQFAVYLWNYNRIAPDYHEQFAVKWAHDTCRAKEANLIDTRVLPEAYLVLMQQLLDDPSAFCRAHPDQIEYHDFVDTYTNRGIC